jgi:hypothetical protein
MERAVLSMLCGACVQIAMLLCTANVFWQDMRTGGEPATRDTAGVKEVFSRAVAAAARAEKLFRGERWGHPGALYLDVLDAAKQFRSRARARGCWARRSRASAGPTRCRLVSRRYEPSRTSRSTSRDVGGVCAVAWV